MSEAVRRIELVLRFGPDMFLPTEGVWYRRWFLDVYLILLLVGVSIYLIFASWWLSITSYFTWSNTAPKPKQE